MNEAAGEAAPRTRSARRRDIAGCCVKEGRLPMINKSRRRERFTVCDQVQSECGPLRAELAAVSAFWPIASGELVARYQLSKKNLSMLDRQG